MVVFMMLPMAVWSLHLLGIRPVNCLQNPVYISVESGGAFLQETHTTLWIEGKERKTKSMPHDNILKSSSGLNTQ